MRSAQQFAVWLLLGTSAAAQIPDAAVTPGSAAGMASQTQPSPKAVTKSSAEQPAGAGQPAEVPATTDSSDLHTMFKVKYVAEGVVYLDAGRNAGLAEGMKLVIRESTASPTSPNADAADPGKLADLVVISVAENSSVAEVHSAAREIKAGDTAYLSANDQNALVEKSALSSTRKYPAVISFTEGDTLDEEVRQEMPRPPSPIVNRARGRIGLDYMGTISHGSSGLMTSSLGVVMRTDITRINGTYWNVSGYWRGRLTSQSSSGQATLQDLMNRTYHLAMTYENPQSAWLAGFGRMYLPWASSLDTIDGGYFGRKVSKGTTLGIFGGSTPDPTSWSYDPNREIGGGFINFEGGSYDAFHYSSTFGGGVDLLKWQVDKPFGFMENSLSYKRTASLYQAMQIDSPSGNPAVAAPGTGIGRSFVTLHVQVHPRVGLDFNHTYFRDIPTFDPSLIGTGLLDKYLFQGFSVGARVLVWKQITVYNELGRSNRTGDAKSSLNQAYGVTIGRVPWIKTQADLHYSRFNSSFGSGSYKAFSLSRNLTDNFRFDLLAGDQNYSSSFSTNNHSRFLNLNVESNFGAHYFLMGGYTISRGLTQSYDQWMITLGYRFDSKEE
jgi:hypothetical protein